MKLIRIVICLFSIFIGNIAIAMPDIVVKNNEKVSGLNLHEYANMWWQWAVSMSDKESPLIDRTGINCSVNQIGPVWFLAGGYGSSKIKRKCSIPSDKHIFFPVINMVYYPPNLKSNFSCESVKSGAALNNQHLSAFKVRLDDEVFMNPVFFRSSSVKCFDLIARKKNNSQQSKMYPSATDGYWVMLKPLSVGTHEIAFRAEYNRPGGSYGKMVQDIEYTIEIYEP